MLRFAHAAPAAQGLRHIAWAAVLGCALTTPLAALAQGKVYVSSEKDNKIYVFDAKGERLSAIDTCERPRHMMFNANRSQIYVCCGDSNQLGLVDTATGKMTGTVPLGDSPEIFDLSPDGKTVYVSIEDENVMAAYDLATKKPLFEVKTGGEPEGVLVTADGKFAYVTSEVANVVHYIDLGQKKVLKNIKVGKRPRRFVLAEGGSELWVTNELDATVSVVNTKDHSVKATIKFAVQGMREADITPVGMTPSTDGKTMWVGLGKANHVVEVDVATKKAGRQVLVGKRAWGLTMHPDGKTLYVTNGLSDDMTLIDTASAKAIKTVAVGRVPHSVLVQPLMRVPALQRAAATLALLASVAWPAAQAATTQMTLAVISLAGDARYANRRMERGYPGHPQGRALQGVQLALEEAAFELDTAGIALTVRDVVLPDMAALPKALADLKAAKVQHLVADLPLAELRQLVQTAPAALGGAVVFNTGLDDDSLRAQNCAAHLLHTLPSASMRADTLAQYLAARNWRKVLLLQGPEPGDVLMGAAFTRAAKRYGLKITQTKPFKLSGDPRERDLSNTRLLTGEREHEVVAVMDADGEFARTLPYATQWPRPVVGASGLVAQAWHPQWERNGGPQLTRRFQKMAQRPMQSHDWAAWAAGKAVASLLVDDAKAPVPQQLKKLRAGTVVIDGFKGPRLSFRAWDGQLRQPMFVSHVDGVVGLAPLEGVLHPKEVLDTLGVDETESACKQRP